MPNSKLFSYRDKLQVLYRKLEQLSGECWGFGQKNNATVSVSQVEEINTWEKRVVGRIMEWAKGLLGGGASVQPPFSPLTHQVSSEKETKKPHDECEPHL